MTILTVLDDQVISQHLCRAIARKTNTLFCLWWLHKHMWNTFTWKNTHKSKLRIRYICTHTYNYINRWIDDIWLKEIAHVHAIQHLSTFGHLGLFSADKKGRALCSYHISMTYIHDWPVIDQMLFVLLNFKYILVCLRQNWNIIFFCSLWNLLKKNKSKLKFWIFGI